MIVIILLSLDASISSTGYAIFDEDKLIKYGKIVTNKKNFENEDLRLNHICDKIEQLIIKYEIDELVCEDQFASVNSKTILILRKLIGGIMRTANRFDINIHYYFPNEWRKILGINKGTSNDKKKKCYDYLIKNNIIDFEFIPKNKDKNDDICDAIGIGLAYLKNILIKTEGE